MVRPMGNRPKWLAGLVILVLAALFISGCPPSSQPPTDQPPVDEPPANQPPVIDSLTSQWRQVKKAMAVPIECAARDPDGDDLSYAWSATGGSISGEGAAVSWIAPDAYDTYTITVTVTDGEGGQDTESLEIGVACCLREADE